jgi:hypothetical protein
MGEQVYADRTRSYLAGCFTYSILGQRGTGNTFLNDYTPDARWRGNLLVTWEKGGLAITPSMSFVSSGIRDYLGVTRAAGALYQEVLTGQGLPPQLVNYGYHPLTDNHVAAYFLFNLNGTYSFNQGLLNGLQLFTQVNKVLNKQPPFAVGGGTFGPGNSYGGTNPIFYDTLGLAFRVGFRYKF